MSRIAVRTARLTEALALPYAEVGEPGGTPLVFVHGWADSWWTFEPLLRRLPAGLHAYAFTQRGHGDADRPTDGYTPADLAEDLLAFLDTVGIGRAVLIGGSSGGVQARIVAGRHPDRVAGLVFLGVPATLADKPVAREVRALVRELRDPVGREFAEAFSTGLTDGSVDPDFLETVITESLKAPARVWRDTMLGLLDTDLRATLDGISAPTLVVWGDRDDLLPRSDQQVILDAIPGARLVVHEGAGHVVYWERPADVVRDIAEFAALVG
ncbi:pimeloyl-ACP methyl ester carboxylesterase [Kitasatospora gansuensis]|uniref:Pimeloyl-ACP methyl ester carboxylesterase n=1 Tax=Kitasatospora gansuensis TaxID=258050 RepID=A0A7W7S7Z7_9ACTN|nr:alpha/beta hydrolase [Kitasatospora gansuensis]MBB4945589.1 pimeloyl-ACP methyl ester carboxylesterase [Kitasatospora gansuensis]